MIEIHSPHPAARLAALAVLLLAGPAAAAPGELDPDFWGAGFFDFPPTSIGLNVPCRMGPMAVGPDGTILVVGNLDAPESCARELFAVTESTEIVVPIREQGGFLPPDVWSSRPSGAIAAMPDGRWVIATHRPHPRISSLQCVVAQRLTAALDLDPEFSGDGVAWGQCGPAAYFDVRDVAVGAGGAVYVVGQTTTYTGYQPFLQVFSVDGAHVQFRTLEFFGFDPEWMPSHSLERVVVKRERSGETLWVGGDLDMSWYGQNGYQVFVARLDTYGNTAPSFAGVRTFGPATLGGLALAPDGGVFVGMLGEPLVVRLRPDGSNNGSFGFFGSTLFDFVPGVADEVQFDLFWSDPTDRLYVLGRSTWEGERRVVIRALTATAAADFSFGDLGTGTAVLPATDLPSVEPDRLRLGVAAGRIVAGASWHIGGGVTGSSENRNRIYRLLP
jgi:hypothetical protein